MDLDLDSGFNLYIVYSKIDVGQIISIGPGKFDKKNKCRALNAL